MTTEGEQQEAVCGTCGGAGVFDNDPLPCVDCNGTGRIPAPVVPSDERCEAYVDADGERPIRCGHVDGSHLTLLSGEVVCCECDAREESSKHAYAPPTPSQDAESARNDSDRPQRSLSQDAEGDGTTQKHYPLRPRDTAREVIKIATGRGVHEHKVQAIANMLIVRDEVRESAIREPYEALVKAARCVLNDQQSEYECGFCTGSNADHEDECVIQPFAAALTRIEESLGGH